MSKIPHPRLVAGVQGSSWKLISFRILKAQETVLEGKIGVKFTCNFALNCQFVLVSLEIPWWHRGVQGEEPPEAHGFSVLN